MKRIFITLLALTLLMSTLTFTACNNQDTPTSSETTSNDNNHSVPGIYGDTFEMYVYDDEANTLTDDKAKISISIVLEKESDISNKNAYSSSGHIAKYSYSIHINGTMDSKYAGKTLDLSLCWLPSYQNTSFGWLGETTCLISETGEFSYTSTYTRNLIFTEYMPTRIAVRKTTNW